MSSYTDDELAHMGLLQGGARRGAPARRQRSGAGRETSTDIAPRLSPTPAPEVDLACAVLPLTDLGNAERWQARHGASFRFCDKIGWFNWDGRRWRLLSEEKDALPAEVMQSVFATVRAIRNEAALIAALGCDDPEGIDGERLLNFRAWAAARKAEGWDRIERSILGTVEPGEGGSPSIAAGRLVDQAKALIEASGLRDIALEASPSKRKLWSDAIAAHARASEASGKLASIAKLARALPGIAVEPDAFDRDRMAINVLNGTLRLRPRRIRRSAEEVASGKGERKTEGWKIVREPHRREDLITKLAPVKFAPSAVSPVWDSFIERVQPDVHMRRWLHQWGGLSLTGEIGEQKLAFFYGTGRNGKGTAIEAIAHLAGDYAGSIPIESFLENGVRRRGDQATPDIARLPGVRFLRVSEPERGSRLNEGLIKMVTGGDPVDARHLNKGFFTFLPEFKMTISGNHKPEIKDTSDGIWRRMQLVPWAVTIPREEVDRELPEKLKSEASGILNRLLEGLCDWRENGLIEPDEVRMATAAYRDQSDELGRFLADTCEVGEDMPGRPIRVGAKVLHDTYLAWCEQVGGAGWKPPGFKKAMLDKGFEQKASDGMKWLGVRLRNGIDADSIREGRWSAPDDSAGGCDDGKSHEPEWGERWSAGDDWVPGD